MKKKAPGKAHRQGISLLELQRMFPNERTAERWFEKVVWDGKPVCHHCGSTSAAKIKSRKPMPYRCRDCRKHFSVRTGTIMAQSRLPLQKWAIAIYIQATSLKGVSSMKIHRDLGVTQKTAWYLMHRLREALPFAEDQFDGPVEVDESYIGGRRKNMSNAKRKALKDTGRGAVGKAPVVGIRDRKTNKVKAVVAENTDGQTLGGFIEDRAKAGSQVYTDDARAYLTLSEKFIHESVNHSVSEYVKGQAHTNGIESFWSMLKRGYHGTFHHVSKKHLHRYVNEFAERHNLRERDTLAMMKEITARLIGRNLSYAELTHG